MKFAVCGVLCVIQFVFFIGAQSSTSKYKSILRPRILGGNSADIGSFPYQVSLRHDDGYGRSVHFCGGSIVSERHIVTAAHCVKTELDRKQNIRIFTGTSRSDIAGGQSHRVSNIVVHPEYIGWPNQYLNDIAVVTLSEPIVFSDRQRAIELPTRDVENLAAATITGWGDTTAPDGATPIYLQQAPMTLLDFPNCQAILPSQSLRHTQVCASHGNGDGSCAGDSGGPLVSNGYLVGVASYVVECGGSDPDVYTNVYSFLDFIKKIVNSETSLQNNGQKRNIMQWLDSWQ